MSVNNLLFFILGSIIVSCGHNDKRVGSKSPDNPQVIETTDSGEPPAPIDPQSLLSSSQDSVVPEPLFQKPEFLSLETLAELEQIALPLNSNESFLQGLSLIEDEEPRRSHLLQSLQATQKCFVSRAEKKQNLEKLIRKNAREEQEEVNNLASEIALEDEAYNKRYEKALARMKFNLGQFVHLDLKGCRKKLGIGKYMIGQMTDKEVYRLHKCESLIRRNKLKSNKDLLKFYLDASLDAATFISQLTEAQRVAQQEAPHKAQLEDQDFVMELLSDIGDTGYAIDHFNKLTQIEEATR